MHGHVCALISSKPFRPSNTARRLNVRRPSAGRETEFESSHSRNGQAVMMTSRLRFGTNSAHDERKPEVRHMSMITLLFHLSLPSGCPNTGHWREPGDRRHARRTGYQSVISRLRWASKGTKLRRLMLACSRHRSHTSRVINVTTTCRNLFSSLIRPYRHRDTCHLS